MSTQFSQNENAPARLKAGAFIFININPLIRSFSNSQIPEFSNYFVSGGVIIPALRGLRSSTSSTMPYSLASIAVIQ